jgi:hypothetical protein
MQDFSCIGTEKILCLVGYNIVLMFFREDYVKRIAHKLVIMEHNQQRVLQAASGSNQQVQTGCQIDWREEMFQQVRAF